MYIGLQVLRAKIRGFQSAGESIHHKISTAKGLRRQGLWHQKRYLGSFNREHLIAYGLLRGISYERIERCSEENKPNAEKILELMKQHSDWKTSKDLTLAKVQQLLSKKPLEALTSPQEKGVQV